VSRLRKQTLDGNVETMLLAVLEAGPSYGYAVIQELEQQAEGIVQLGEGTVYPVLHRLEEKNLLTSSWRKAGNQRKRKYYRLTRKGRKVLAENRLQWQLLSRVMEKMLGPGPAVLPQPKPQGVEI
jgi:PadR family transcriptional regulator PadR